MYLRTVKRKRTDGTHVAYLQLAHNHWDPTAGHSVPRVLHSFGRADTVDRDAIARLIGSLSRLLPPDETLAMSGTDELEFVESRPMGANFVLDGVWSQLGIDKTLRRLLKSRRLDPKMERVLFALVANRAVDPGSKLAASGWVTERTHIDGLDQLDSDSCFRAMDWLLDCEGELVESVFWATADLLNLEVDLLFFDTTSTYFETPTADQPADGATVGFRTWGKSKDHRADLPQIVIGMAVTRTGIPIRVWSWPGNTNDQALIRQVKDDLANWRLGHVIWVADRGFSSAENRRYLQRAGGNYIIGEKIRGNTEAATVLARPGRYHEIRDNMRVKEVVIDDGAARDRFVICHNPEQAERDETIRTQLVERLRDAIDNTDQATPDERVALTAGLPGAVRRYLRTTKTGLLRVDKTTIRNEAKLDGKYLLRTADPSLTVEDIACGYKQLLEVERGWRDMKSTLDLRPVYHRLEDRIRAHVILCWLALLHIRIVESRTDDTWTNIRRQLDLMALGTFTGTAGTIARRTATTPAQKKILAAVGLKEPAVYTKIAPATAT